MSYVLVDTTAALYERLNDQQRTIDAQQRTIDTLLEVAERRQAGVHVSSFEVWTQNMALEEIISRKTARLREAEASLRTIVDAFPAPMCILDDDNKILLVNDDWRAKAEERDNVFSGFSQGDDYEAFAASSRADPGGRSLLTAIHQVHLFEGSPLVSWESTFAFVCAETDKERWYQVQIRKIGTPGEHQLIIAHLDITSRVEAEQALQAERELLELVVAHIPHGVYWKDAAGRYLGCNDAYATLLDRTHVLELLGHTDLELFGDTEHGPIRHREDIKVMQEALPRLGQPEVLETAPRTQQLLHDQVPLCGSNGSLTGLLGIYTDITEVNDLERQLAQARRLESIGQLSAGIAHEINTPMQYVGDNIHFLNKAADLLLTFAENVEALAEELGEQDPIAEQLSGMLRSARVGPLRQRMPRALSGAREGVEAVSKIVQAMKGFAHPGAREMQPAQINDALETTATVARNEWRYHAELELELEPELPLVTCDLAELNQVFLNLIINASHAIAEHRAEGDKGRILLRTSAPEPGWVEISITDDGSGISPEHLARIYDPFFTTKEVGRGTGQGLAISHNVIVEHHSGTLECHSVVGQGTTFVIRLPILPQGDA